MTKVVYKGHSSIIIMYTLQVLKYTAGHINYGGRVTDDWDRRCIMNILNDFYRPEVLSDNHIFSESGIYHQMSAETSHKVYIHLRVYIFVYVQFICMMTNRYACTCVHGRYTCTYTAYECSQINS